MVDKVYDVGNTFICGTSCPCVADRDLWDAPTKATIITSNNGYQNFPQCKGAELAVKGLGWVDSDFEGNITLGFNALNQMERFFSCAKICG
mmetsp:Transcript_30729/g.22817  ORF Transcript_30729/g.22817 Transcript_30729/m.22817 type:complete len:91 (+) Transcript_30729:386-658(+)